MKIAKGILIYCNSCMDFCVVGYMTTRFLGFLRVLFFRPAPNHPPRACHWNNGNT